MDTVKTLLEDLDRKGFELWTEEDKLKIRSPKGSVTPDLRKAIANNKEAIVLFLRDNRARDVCSSNLDDGELSLPTIGYMINGGSDNQTGIERSPIVDPELMAKKVKVSFRPLPPRYRNQTVINFRQNLEELLRKYGANVVPWEKATKEYFYDLKLPLLNHRVKLRKKMVDSNIDAVIDVDRPASIRSRAESYFAEQVYKIYSFFLTNKRENSISKIALMIGWAEESAAKFIEDPMNTQIIVLSDIDPEFTSDRLSYQDKIPVGIGTLIRTFSEIVVGVSESNISILNMNLSDSLFSKSAIDRFVLNSLIPKIFVPISPLLMSQFQVGTYDSLSSRSASELVRFGNRMNATGLLPAGFNLQKTIKRKSYRDIVDVIVNGRSGVSYGFLAYIEPPKYIGKIDITEEEWQSLSPVEGIGSNELRKNELGRNYIRIKLGSRICFRQVPDIWLVSSRSGSNKTNLDIETDVLRIGLTDRLQLMVPESAQSSNKDIKPSYDIYVMVSIALSVAIHMPELIKAGAPIAHFHGYPSSEWFIENEYFAGSHNPSVPCGTYESGAFNFLSLRQLERRGIGDTKLIALVEPDHGTNIISDDVDYLVERLVEGCSEGLVQLGGKHMPSLMKSEE